MPIPDRRAPTGVLCVCGRNLNEVHCPNCGSFHIQARLRDVVINERAWKCLRCKARFNDEDRAQCIASPVRSLTMKQLRQQDAAVNAVAVAVGADKSLSYDERKAKLFDLLKQAKKQPRGEQE